ncbi:apolipoprotein N-acyltransferase [Candidatus Omnitrophota bacterium]
MKNIKFKNLLLTCLTAALLVLSFPRFSFWPLAWIAFIPLLFALDDKTQKRSFLLSYLAGVVFFSCMIYWFVHVTIVGAILLVLYFAVYFGLFGFLISWVKSKSLFVKIICIPGIWVLLEYLRAHLLSGFGWASLGHSQYPFIPIIQIADITGVWGLSFLMMAVNVFLKEAFVVFLTLRDKSSVTSTVRRVHLLRVGCLVVLCFVAILSYGFRQVAHYQQVQSDESVLVAVVQANIAQEDKWQEVSWPKIRDRYIGLTQEAASALRERQKQSNIPGLIIWPETAFPGFLWEDQDFFEEIQALVKEVGIPLLFGSVVYEKGQYFNAAILLSEKGEVMDQYNKLHLVPFGEFLPFRTWMPALADLVPIADFTGGQRWTVFPISEKETSAAADSFFSVLICFEDTIGALSRGFVNHGAKLLINMTNDAWFRESKASTLHMVCGLFRAVENRRVLIRAANTGVSCVINATGEIVAQLRDKRTQSSFISGYFLQSVSLHRQKTFYTKYGDVFMLGVVFFMFLFLGVHFFRRG